MNIAGLDPSSTISGGAVADGEKLLETWVWTKQNNRSSSQNLWDYFTAAKIWLSEIRTTHDVGVVVIEFLAVQRNAKVTRVVAHFQAASVLAAKSVGLIVVEAKTSTARKYALGNGGLSKDEAYEVMMKRFPDFKWQKTSRTLGRYDEVDAGVLALAGPQMLERVRP